MILSFTSFLENSKSRKQKINFFSLSMKYLAIFLSIVLSVKSEFSRTGAQFAQGITVGWNLGNTSDDNDG
jgi:hypothetical protein